jgi:ATP-binding cassette, subfamily B, bacterial
MLMRRRRPTTLRASASEIRRLFHHLRPYLPEQRALIVGAALALISAAVMRLAEPWPLKLVIDRVISVKPGKGLTGIELIDQMPPTSLLVLCAVMAVGATAIRALMEYVSTIGFALAGSRVLARLRHDLYRHLHTLSLAFHDRARTGDLTMRIVGDVGMLRDAAVTAFLPLVTNILILTGMAGVMLWLDWRLALLALSPLPLLALTTVRLGRRIQTVSREQRKREGSIAAAASEAMAGMRSVQALSLEDRMARLFASHNSGSLKDGVKAKRIAARLERETDLLVGVSTALVLWYGTKLVLAGALTAGDLIVFLTYLKNAFRPIRDFAKNSSRIAKAAAAGERVVDLLDQQSEVRDRPDARVASRFHGELRFEGVSFAYAGGQPILEQLDLVIEPGETVALVGASGAGKSTLSSLVMRLYDPTSGRILIDGQDICGLTVASLRAQISVVLQDSLLFSESVKENIALARPDASEAEIEAAARLANAHDFIMDLPDGYATVVAERGATLSAGQRQRLAIARAALRRAPILILDEPTASLDRENEGDVILALRGLMKSRTVLLVTHDLELAAQADRIIVLEQGRITEAGSHAALLARRGRYARLVRSSDRWRLSMEGEDSHAFAR